MTDQPNPTYDIQTAKSTDVDPNNPSDNSQQEFIELLKKQQDQTIKLGSLIDAEVISIDKDYVRLSTGLKSDSFVSIDEFKTINESGDEVISIQLGDQVKCILLSVDNGLGETIISYSKAQYIKAWQDLEVAMQEGKVIKGFVNSKIKGGLNVQIGPIKAFLPGSLVDISTVVDVGYLENSEIECKVINMDKVRNNVVISRRAIFEDELDDSRQELIEQLVEGAEVEGIIKNITDYGAFIDLGGVDGLLHITDIAWERVNHPSEILSIAQRVKVKVLHYDNVKNRVSLGMKQLIKDPWQEKTEGLKNGMIIKGRVSTVMDYGCFVEIKEGVDGLVHSSEFDWTNKNINPRNLVRVEDEFEVYILNLDVANRRISLSLKRCTESPWIEFSKKYKKGDKVSGKIKSITDFGLFVGLENGLDGLVHVGDLDWNLPENEAIKKYKKDQQVEAVVLAVKVEDERISLGIKQLTEDVFGSFISKNPKNSTIQAPIKAIHNDGIELELAQDLKGIIAKKELITDLNNLKADQLLSAMVINYDFNERVIYLSEKLQSKKDERTAVRDYAKKAEQNTQSTLGDILKQQIAQDRKQKELEEKKSKTKKTTQKNLDEQLQND